MADIQVTIEDAQPINVSLGEAVNVYQGGTSDYNELVNTPDLSLKQDTLVSGANIKTVNGSTLLGSGDLTIAGGGGGGAWGAITGTLSSQTDLQSALDGKQPVGDYATNTALTSGLATKADTSSLAPVATSGDYADLTNKPTIPSVAGLATETYVDNAVAPKANTADLGTAAATDATDYATAAQGAKADTAIQPAALTASLSTKQDTLVSGTNIKTINSTSILGSGDIVISGGAGAVDSVNSKTGNVVLNQDDIGDGTTYKQYSATEKTKLSGIAENANNYTHPATHSADIITDGTTNKAYTATEQSKLAGIALGAEVNVQSDWTQATNTADDYIKNKPTLGTAAAKNIPATGNASATEVVYGSDTRLSDARTPTTHTHAQSDITNLTTDLGSKEPTITAGTTGQYYRGDKSWQTLDKTAVGLGNVSNLAPADMPVSTAQQTALNAKVGGTTTITVGTTAPSSPSVNDLWIDTN